MIINKNQPLAGIFVTAWVMYLVQRFLSPQGLTLGIYPPGFSSRVFSRASGAKEDSLSQVPIFIHIP
jgi:hypothetical protein